MSQPLKRIIALAVMLLAIKVEASPAETLTFIWHKGTCADIFSQIAQDYPAPQVEIVPRLVPYGAEFHDTIAAGLASHDGAFDFAMWDSQSTAEFASAGHVISMNEIFEKSSVLTPELFDPLSLARYGEYPDESGQYWSLSVNQDVYGLMYRKDLFENPKEQTKFLSQYGYPLDVPQTFQQARDIAEFFTRPDEGLFGWGQMGGVTMTLLPRRPNSYLWSFGGELYNPQTFEVKGYINSPASVDGIQFYIDWPIGVYLLGVG